MSKHNHTLSINRDIYIYRESLLINQIENIIFFRENYTRTCYICLWHEILLENDTYDRINFYLICLV